MRPIMKPDEIKRHEREAYDAVAEVYNKSLAEYSARFARDLIDLMFPQKGEAALDIAGGTGAAGLKVAERIGKDGNVTITDISPGMLEQARKNATARDLSNVETRVMDAERLDFPDATFDIVTCSMGIMFVPNVRLAIAEAYRVLKPGGRIGYTVWSVPERFPFFACPMTAVLKRMAPAPIRLLLRAPGIGSAVLRKLLVSSLASGFSPARFSATGSLEKHLTRAGFQSVRRERRAYPLEFRSFEEFWDTITKGTPARTMARLPAKVIAEVKEEVRAHMMNPTTGALYFHNEAALVLARKPA
jgi:ubiquinone/menaquinone biosynthesis C-methylase UbiE